MTANVDATTTPKQTINSRTVDGATITSGNIDKIKIMHACIERTILDASVKDVGAFRTAYDRPNIATKTIPSIATNEYSIW